MRADVINDRYADHRQDQQCPCRSCRRRAALRSAGPSLVNGFEDRRDEPDMPPRHPVSGRFLAPPHPEDDGRDTSGRFIDDLTRQVHEQR
jgi:hypothetical protein